MGLLPTSDTDATSEQTGELRVVGVGDDEAGEVIDAVASETARDLLASIHDDPATASQLADRTGASLQNVSYHLEKLEDAGLVRVADTRYSEKGREMDVYAPADDPVVVFVGTEERETSFLELLRRLVGAAVLLGLATAFVFVRTFGLAAPPGGAAPVTPLERPFVAFFLGGAFVLALVTLWWLWRRLR